MFLWVTSFSDRKVHVVARLLHDLWGYHPHLIGKSTYPDACECAKSDSLKHYGLQFTGLLYLWDSPNKNIGVGYYLLLQSIFPRIKTISYVFYTVGGNVNW